MDARRLAARLGGILAVAVLAGVAGAPCPSSAQSRPTGYYVEPGSYGTKRETPVPQYVRQASKTGIDALSELDWLDLGLDHRIRYELRDDDYRRATAKTDNLFLFRTRAYFGIKNIIDPLRLVVEVEDARSDNNRFKRDNRDVNGAEPIQLIAELHFKDALGKDALGQNRPLSLRAGRMWFEKLDRRLIGNNAWRNTTNTFQGIHLDLGREENDWEFELIAAQPLDRKLYEFDRTNEGQWFIAAIGHWRRWSEVVTLEPYYLLLSQDDDGNRTKREIHSPALRFYGPIAATAFHYDVNLVYQTGQDAGRDHRAFGATSELGYRFQHEWKPRVSAFYGYASGDKSPDDNNNERFERYYGFARPWSANDYFIWENFHAPKARLELTPLKDLRLDAGYSAYWLASDTDRWANANLRDPTGQSGDFIGHEFDMRARYQVTPRIDATMGYAHFEPGGWTKNVGRDNPSDFFYLELTFNAFPRT
ncbi:MAG: alginate export family protein [Candidatus Binatia bacterium]